MISSSSRQLSGAASNTWPSACSRRCPAASTKSCSPAVTRRSSTPAGAPSRKSVESSCEPFKRKVKKRYILDDMT